MKRPAFTIVEMIVVIFILSIFGGVVTQYIVKSYSNNQQVEAGSIVQKDLNLAVDRFNRVLRSSTELLEATATTIKIRGYPNVGDTAPSEIYFYIQGTAVKYSVIPPTGTAPNYTYNSANAKYYTLLPNVINNSGATPLFRFYSDTNVLQTLPVSLANVKSIEFAPVAKDAQNVIKIPVSVTTRATLRNFKTNL